MARFIAPCFQGALSRASWQVNTKLTRPSKNAGLQRDRKLPAGCVRRDPFAQRVEVDTTQAERHTQIIDTLGALALAVLTVKEVVARLHFSA